MESLENTLNYCLCRNIAIIGGGPSLDFSMEEIEHLYRQDTVFFLTDIISDNFIKIFPDSKRLIFTVEAKPHNYLKNLANEKIAAHVRADTRNYSKKKNHCYSFHFDIDKPGIKNSFEMKSPGTVAGAAIYWALSVSKRNQNPNNIILFGIDLSYIDNQVYNRLCKFSFQQDYWTKRENREWIAILKKTADIQFSYGYVIRSSREFSMTKEKLEILIQNQKNIMIMDYSPMGISENLVKKVIPKKIMFEQNRDIIR